jgi:regulatory protein YycI of two-component signal transduction system YycFG
MSITPILKTVIDFIVPFLKQFWAFLNVKISIPLFVLLIPTIFGTVYYLKFRKETKKIEAIATRAISTNVDLRMRVSADSIQIIQLNNEKERIINYHFAYLDTIRKMPKSELQAELNRQFE